MSKEKSDSILKLAVKQFFVEKEVASTLVMDSLYSGLKSLQVQTKNKKLKGKCSDAAQLPIPIIRVEKDAFILVDDVLALLQRAAVEPLPPKDDKGSQNRTKDGGSGDDFSKESIERDERRLTELGRRTIELFVLSHIFSKIEVEYQEAVALKRQEELIREEEAEWMTGIEQKAKRGASEKDKKSKKKQGKQKRNNRKLKDKGKDEITGATVIEEEDKPQQQNPIDGRKGILIEDAELLLDTPEDVSDASDSVNCVLDEAHALADSDDRDSSPVNYDTDTSEAQPPIGFVVHNGARKSPSMIDDSSSTCSTDSLPSVVYKEDLLQNQKSQKSPTSGKNKQGSILSEVTGSEAANSPVAGSCKMNELESDVVVLSLQDGVTSVEQHVSKKVEDVVTLQKDASAKDEVDPKTKERTSAISSSKTNLKISTSSDPAISRRSPLDKTLNTDKVVNAAASSASPKPFGHTIGTQKAAEKVSKIVQESISTGKAINGPGTSLTNDKPVHHQVSKPPPVQQVPVSVDKPASQPVSRPSSAPLVPGPRPSSNLPVVSMVNAAPFLPRSVSAAGRLGPDASAPATQSVVPQSYRNAIMGNPATSSSTTFSQPHSPNLTYSQPPHSPIISAAPMFLPHSSDSSISARNGFSSGMANRDLLQNGSQWMGISSSSRGLHNDHSLLNDIQNIDLRKPRSHDHLSNYEFPAKHRQAHGTLADEFPHLDIINDLLDDEHGMPSASEVSPLFPNVSNGPNHLSRQFTYPGGSLDTSSCRFEPSHSYHDEFPFSYGGGGAQFDLPREMVTRQPNLQPYTNFDELTHNQWPMGGSSEISYPGLRNMDNDGYHQYPNYSNNLMMGANGYTVYRPSNGH